MSDYTMTAPFVSFTLAGLPTVVDCTLIVVDLCSNLYLAVRLFAIGRSVTTLEKASGGVNYMSTNIAPHTSIRRLTILSKRTAK